MKKNFLIFLSFIILLSIMPAAHAATERGNIKEPILAAVKKDGKWGFINSYGKLVIPNIYDEVKSFQEGLAVVTLNGKKGVIDASGKIVIDLQYKRLSSFNEGVAYFDDGTSFSDETIGGFIDKSGKVLFEPRKGIWGSFSNGRALIRVKDKDGYDRHGFIDKKGNEVIKPLYEYATPFSEGYAYVYGTDDKSGKFIAGLINTKGEIVYPASFTIKKTKNNCNITGTFTEGFAPVTCEKGGDGYMDKSSNVILLGKLYSQASFSEGIAQISLRASLYYGYIDTKGKYIFKPQSNEENRPFSDGLAFVGIARGEKTTYGYINNKGKVVFNVPNNNYYSFSNGYAAFEGSNGKFGYINKQGKVVITPQFDIAWEFKKPS
ncbi:hypothetical protein GE107_21485 [Cohnella sp. CFH 77786]|uniref:WG repeat-containing protein n=1 Tax=Cohnella sp. CFH 77786 TaxID=2662265 RepID=UPI001C60C18F|nr:WG repeat-containing protein [Cohnella sp. CFH 77786]MBW5448623.1 hypothetical protein [Cohnella sp. CFH 77786]